MGTDPTGAPQAVNEIRSAGFTDSEIVILSDGKRSAAAGEALAGQATEFTFGDVEPASVFGGVDEIEAFHIDAGLSKRERFIEDSPRVRIEVVTR